MVYDFNPRTPRGVRQIQFVSDLTASLFQSTHPARGATRGPQGFILRHLPISIHAPREGCDDAMMQRKAAEETISIHAPREGCDIFNTDFRAVRVQFQSTHPARGATCGEVDANHMIVFQSTHPARGATPSTLRNNCGRRYFNPRTPRGVRLSRSSHASR